MSILRRLEPFPSPPGREQALAAAVAALWREAGWEARSDPLGNVLAHLPFAACRHPRPRLLLAAHLDQIALVVTRREAGGFVRVAALGGVDVHVLPGQEVTVLGRRPVRALVSTLPPHLTGAADRQRAPELDELVVDTGLPDAELEQLVQPGDAVVLRAPLRALQGSRLAGPALDDRAGLAALTLLARQLAAAPPPCPVWLVATVQEEVGLRGAQVAAFGLEPDIALAVDVGFADQPGVPAHQGFSLGGGPVLGRGPNVAPAVLAALQEAAAREGIPFRLEALPGASGTDAWSMQVAGRGTATGVVSIPARCLHGPQEVVDASDVEATARLLAAFARGLSPSWGEGRMDVAAAFE